MSTWRDAEAAVNRVHQSERDQIALEHLAEDFAQDLNEIMHGVLKKLISERHITTHSLDGSWVVMQEGVSTYWEGIDDHYVEVRVRYGSVYWRLQKGIDDDSIDGVRSHKIAEGFALGITPEAEFARWLLIGPLIDTRQKLEEQFADAKQHMMVACVGELRRLGLRPPAP